MRCPYCGSLDTQVKDSRPTDDSSAIRRRRICPDCGGRFTTFERVQLRELMVVKRSGRRVPFDRDKLQQSVDVALRKRPVEPERVERMINGIVRQLESMGDGEVPSETVGELVMEGLKGLDDVAYVRFASVYKNFREAKDFEEILGKLAEARSRGRPAASAEDEAAPERAMNVPAPIGQPPDRTVTTSASCASRLRSGARHLGLTWPNPSVGAVRGRRERRGAGHRRSRHHAAGRQAACGADGPGGGRRARPGRDALRDARALRHPQQPDHGPSCTDLILAAGIGRLVVGARRSEPLRRRARGRTRFGMRASP